MQISISEEIADRWEKASLGILHYTADVSKSTPDLLKLFDNEVLRIKESYILAKIVENRHIAATRQAYKSLGKDPNAYRNAAEAMLRRVVKGNGLYQINNVVDINNLVSVSSGYSIGSYDVSQLNGDLILRRAEEGEHYSGIGKSSVNIEFLPTLYDEQGPFGNPTSDSQRAMITSGNREIISVLYSFDGKEGLNEWMEQFAQLLENFADISEVEKWVV